MACSTRILPLVLALAVSACSDDGVAGGDGNGTAAGTTSGGDTAGSATSPGGSSGSEDDSASASASDTDNGTGIDPTGGSTSDTGGSTSAGGGGSACVSRCTEDADCLNNGMNVGLTCSDNGFCNSACEEPADCIPVFSGWYGQPCSTNDQCLVGPCVDYGGETGGCAIEPAKGIDCEEQMLDEVEATDIDGNTVTVCAETGAMCTLDPFGDMSCTVGCETFGCTEPLTCEEDGYCHCTSNDDCVAAATGDTCSSDGFCFFGCDGVEDCEDAFGEPALDGQTFSCEER